MEAILFAASIVLAVVVSIVGIIECMEYSTQGPYIKDVDMLEAISKWKDTYTVYGEDVYVKGDDHYRVVQGFTYIAKYSVEVNRQPIGRIPRWSKAHKEIRHMVKRDKPTSRELLGLDK